jgi:hypothetical protein
MARAGHTQADPEQAAADPPQDSEEQMTVLAMTIPEGGFFRKQTGTIVYLRVSESSVGFHKLDKAKVYGVAYNGNMCCVAPNLPVVPCDARQMDQNRNDDQDWHEQFARPER